MHSDWIWGLAGGLMIGSAAAFLMLMTGRIMGASGIYGRLVDRSDLSDWPGSLAFLTGLIALPYGLARLHPATTHITGNWWIIIAGGLLVGLGTRLANGCTSGHGVCGISRLSPRGIIATVFYVLAGGITMAVMRSVLGLI